MFRDMPVRVAPFFPPLLQYMYHQCCQVITECQVELKLITIFLSKKGEC